MEELIKYLVSTVVGNDDFELTVDDTKAKVTVYKVVAPEESIGKIIGRNGKTIDSIRTILRSANHGNDKKVVVRID